MLLLLLLLLLLSLCCCHVDVVFVVNVVVLSLFVVDDPIKNSFGQTMLFCGSWRLPLNLCGVVCKVMSNQTTVEVEFVSLSQTFLFKKTSVISVRHNERNLLM